MTVISRLYLLIFCISIPLLLTGQDQSCKGTESKKAQKSYDNAIKALRESRSGTAIGLLNKALEYDDMYADAIWRLSQIYFNQMRSREAESFLRRLVSLCPDYNAEAWYMLARIEYGREDYGKAITYLEKFLSDIDRIKSDRDYDNAVFMLDQSKFLNKIMGQQVPFSPFKVQDISTNDDEYLAIISPDGEMALFTRKTKADPMTGAVTWTERYKEQFMVANSYNGKFDRGELMPPPFNMQGNEGGATITARNDELYYTICSNISLNGIVYNNCDIYYSRLIYGQWTPLEKPEFNRDDTWESQPTVSADGKTLYFASDRPGGFGGTDIWVVHKMENNQWGAPKNLGATINTPGNEKTPFIHTDSQTLYFSSADRYDEYDSLFPGHRGLGGYDIFFSRNSNNVWSKPANIGFPINSEADDLSFFVSTDGTTGYFSSNKIEDNARYNLYGFELYQEARPERVVFIKGEIKDEFDLPVIDSRIELKNVVTNEITTVEVDSFSGRYVATAVFENDFVLTVKKPDHIYQSRYIDKDSAIFTAPAEINFEVEKVETGKSYQLHDIHYPTNSAELNRKSLFILDEFIIFLNDNPRVRVAIHGHTDDVGDDAFNMDLSKRRARSVYDYLLEKGIHSSRLTWQGYGKTMPIADNTTDEGRAKNRRTEFVISNK